MSTDGVVLKSVNQESGTATLEREISLDELFNDDDRWVILHDDVGWCGFERERVAEEWVYYYRDTRRPSWPDRVRCGHRAILETVRHRFILADPVEATSGGLTT